MSEDIRTTQAEGFKAGAKTMLYYLLTLVDQQIKFNEYSLNSSAMELAKYDHDQFTRSPEHNAEVEEKRRYSLSRFIEATAVNDKLEDLRKSFGGYQVWEELQKFAEERKSELGLVK